MAGLILFSIAAHQRSRLIFPIMPALALLTGRELARLVARWKPHWPPHALVRAVAGLTAFVLCFLVFHRRELLRHSAAVQRTVEAIGRERIIGTVLNFVDKEGIAPALQAYNYQRRPYSVASRGIEGSA